MPGLCFGGGGRAVGVDGGVVGAAVLLSLGCVGVQKGDSGGKYHAFS